MKIRLLRAFGRIDFFLLPENSPENNSLRKKTKITAFPGHRKVDHLKTGIWILFSILAALALGQLN